MRQLFTNNYHKNYINAFENQPCVLLGSFNFKRANRPSYAHATITRLARFLEAAEKYKMVSLYRMLHDEEKCQSCEPAIRLFR